MVLKTCLCDKFKKRIVTYECIYKIEKGYKQIGVLVSPNTYYSRIINFKDRFTHAQLPLHNMNALNIFQIALFHIIFFMFKYKKKTAPPIFHNLFTPIPKNKYNIQSRGKFSMVIKRERGESMGLRRIKLLVWIWHKSWYGFSVIRSSIFFKFPRFLYLVRPDNIL